MLALHARPDESLALVDLALRREAIDVVESLHPAPNIYFRTVSQEILADQRLDGLRGACRWVHIDGEHSGPAVENDLDLAASLLAPRGVICLDDFFTPAYPQITRATFDWLHRQGGSFALFLLGYNKCYLSRADDTAAYLSFAKERMLVELERRDFAEVTIWKAADPADMNGFGVTPRFRGQRYKGPDWAPDRIAISRQVLPTRYWEGACRESGV